MTYLDETALLAVTAGSKAMCMFDTATKRGGQGWVIGAIGGAAIVGTVGAVATSPALGIGALPGAAAGFKWGGIVGTLAGTAEGTIEGYFKCK